MAEGVAKTFVKAYTNKLRESLEGVLDFKDEERAVDALIAEVTRCV